MLVARRDECITAVQAAYSAGFRHFDLSGTYGNYVEVGTALSGLDRTAFWLTLKLNGSVPLLHSLPVHAIGILESAV